MAKEKNKAQIMATELLQHIPFVECNTITSRPFDNNRTKKVRVCRINDDLWVPTIELANGSPSSSRITKLRNTGELTSKDFLPLRSKGFQPCWFISRAAIIRLQDKLEEIIGWEHGILCLRAILDTISNDDISAEAFEFTKEEAEHIYEVYDRRIELLREGKKMQEQEQDYDEDDFRDEYMKKIFSTTDEEMQEAMSAMEDIDELAAQIVALCMDWVKHTGNRGGDWGNGLVMGLTKATSYLLTALDRQGKKEKGKPSIIEFYQAMLPVCLEIAKNDIEQKEAAEREKRAKDGIN
jgi:hypothetical protein